MKKEDKISKIMMNIYYELYAAATPSIDFELLIEKSPRNEKGQIIIPYDDYEIEESIYNEIIKNIINATKLTKYQKDAIIRSIYLGCSPRFKKID
jgi:hypothetical protein